MAKKTTSVRVVTGQETLPGTEQEVARPKTVIGNRLLAEYVKPHYDRDKEGDRFVAMEFSFGLTKDHAGKLPESVDDAWKFIRKGINRTIGSIEIAPHLVHVYLASDVQSPEISMLFTDITHGALAVVEERGSGKSSEVIRYSFRVRVPVDEGICSFADNSFGNTVWLEMEEAQRKLKGA